MPRTLSLAAPLALLAILATTVACSGDSPASTSGTDTTALTAAADGSSASATTEAATATGEPTGAPTNGAAPEAAAQAAPDPARALEHIRHLSVDIGPRPAGSEAERTAAAYLAAQLSDAGYDATVEEFTFSSARDDSTVSLADGALIRALSMEGGARLEASGTAVYAGLGQPEDLAGADLAGKVVIFDRGVVTFGDKARAAEAAGAIAVIVVNDEPGLFLGSLGDVAVAIPVVGLSGDEAAALDAAIGTSITVNADSGMETITSQNVVGRIGAGECHAYLGGHYDSVTVSPGANDNASGAAVVLEVARVNPVEGLCVVLFGAEELGLFGSQNYVAHHLAGTGRFMLNVDMAGRFDGVSIVGDRDLTTAILDAVEAAGIDTDLRPGRFPPGASSDHVSFEAVGVPAVTFNAGDDVAIHTAQDTFDRIQPEAVAMFVGAVDAALDALVEDHAGSLRR
ncbi:MAG: hypothetical protein DWG80_01705 [Chloroflexi bacterium]|nr:hypothetical protein [Chloroflexota bacterium]